MVETNTIDDLIVITSDRRSPPRRNMVLHSRPGGVKGFFEYATRVSRYAWYEPSKIGNLNVVLVTAAGARRFRCILTARISQDQDARDWLVKTLLSEDQLPISKLVSDLAEEVLDEHFSGCSEGDFRGNPVQPKWDQLLSRLKSECARSGIEIVGTVRLQPVAHFPERQIIFRFDDLKILPKGLDHTLDLPAVITLDAPGEDEEPDRVAAWYTNRRGKDSIRETILKTLETLTNNHYTAHQLRRDAGAIAANVQEALNGDLGGRYGARFTVNISSRDDGSDLLSYAGNFTIDAELSGTGRRNARFEVRFTLQATDEERFEDAFEKDKAAGARKHEAGSTLTKAESAAQQGDRRTWAEAVLTVFCRTALVEAIGSLNKDDVAAIGAVPEGDLLPMDGMVMERLEELTKRVGIGAKVQIHPVTDYRLHALKTGITVTVPKRAYPLAITSAERQLAFQFQVVLDSTSSMRLLAPYFTEGPQTDEEFVKLKADIAERTSSIAAMELGKLTPEEFLDQTDVDNAIATKIQEPLESSLQQEFGLRIQDRLTMTGEPDAVQVRWREIRGLRRFEMPFEARMEFAREPENLTLSFDYEIDRLANPAGSSADHDTARPDAWMRFRNMALDCASTQEHIERFEGIVKNSIRPRLRKINIERFAEQNIPDLAIFVSNLFVSAGQSFGFEVSVIESSLDVVSESGPIEPMYQAQTLLTRLKRLRAAQEQDLMRLDDLEHSSGSPENSVASLFDDEEATEGTDAKTGALAERIRKRGEKIEELEEKMRGIRRDAPKPMIEGQVSQQIPKGQGPGGPDGG